MDAYMGNVNHRLTYQASIFGVCPCALLYEYVCQVQSHRMQLWEDCESCNSGFSLSKFTKFRSSY